MHLVYRQTASAIAGQLGVSRARVSQLRKLGMPIDSIEAARAWCEANLDPARSASQRHSRAGRMPGGEVAAAAEGADRGSGVYWEAKTRREVAEAAMAEHRERELRGELVRKAEVERELAAGLVALREALEVLADRLAAVVAAEADPERCRTLLRNEHRAALSAFVDLIERDSATSSGAPGGASA